MTVLEEEKRSKKVEQSMTLSLDFRLVLLIWQTLLRDQETCIRREEDHKRTALECNLRRFPVRREQEDSGNAH